jgi:hypothetical protein
MLPPTVSRPACLGMKPHLGHKSRLLLQSDSYGFDAFCDERTGPLFTIAAGPRQGSHSRVLSVSRLSSCWPSPAQSFLASVSSRFMIKIFILSWTCTYFEMGPPLRRRRGRSICIGATFVAPQFQQEYIRADTASRSLWTLCHCTILSNIYTKYTAVSMQACKAGYALTYATALKLHSAERS